MRLVVGLGNPGQAYAETRHNAGVWVVNALAAEAGLKFTRHGGADTASGRMAGLAVTVVKPKAYMNRSGPVVAALVDEFSLDLHDMIVVHDDLDLDPGRLRFKSRGGAGGHNGVSSIIDALGSDQFARLKVGVGRPPAGEDPAEYVLAPMSFRERAVFDETVRQAVCALECWMVDGMMAAMNRFNRHPSE